MGRKIEVLVDGAVFTESPRWRDGFLWYSDIGAGEICRVSTSGARELMVSGLSTPSGLGWTAAGDLLVACINASDILKIGADMEARPFCMHERHGAIATNDMATGGSRSYVTCAGREFQPGDGVEECAQPVGQVLMIDHATGEGRVVADGLCGPNGIGITPDGRALLVADCFRSRVLEYDIRDDGSLSGMRVFAETQVMLDGLAIDAEGAVWVGTGQDFRRFKRGGEMTEVVAVPDWMGIAPMLGGPDGRTLFMAVTQHGGADDIFNGTARSRIVATRVDVPAAAPPA